MGCASSKQKRCRQCQGPYSPVPRSYSMHVHHPAQHKGDSYHVVALTSTTLNTIKLEDNNHINVAAFNGNLENIPKINGDLKQVEEESKGLAMEVIEAKIWSKMIEDKIPKVVPKTPIRTPPGEPEAINTWEMMAGLEDLSPLRSPSHIRSFSFDVQKPTWLQIDKKSDLGITDFDPEIISSFRKSLEQIPQEDDDEKEQVFVVSDCKVKNDDEKEQVFVVSDCKVKNDDEKEQVFVVSDCKVKNDDEKEQVFVVSDCKVKNDDKVVLYFTSLRGVRKTYEDCCHVRVILKSLGVRIDERDVSMHSGFKEELKELIGEGLNGGLPRVFVGEKYIGGADEISLMHEEGELEKAVEGCEMVDNDGGGGGNGGACEACGDIRFVPCETCSGSCKVYYEHDYESEEQEHEDEDEKGESGFQRCPDCNENGLIRCPICCY